MVSIVEQLNRASKQLFLNSQKSSDALRKSNSIIRTELRYGVCYQYLINKRKDFANGLILPTAESRIKHTKKT